LKKNRKFLQLLLVSQVADEDDSTSDSDSIEENDSLQRNGQDSSEQKQEESTQKDQSEEHPQILALGRSNFGRSLNPIQLPGNTEIQEAERADCKLVSIFF
jgi:hypothetical protein